MKTRSARYAKKVATPEQVAKKRLVASLSAVQPSTAVEERAEALAEVARKARQAPFLSKYRNRTDPEETAYLLRNPTGAARLMESVEQLRAGQGKARDLLDGSHRAGAIAEAPREEEPCLTLKLNPSQATGLRGLLDLSRPPAQGSLT